MCYVRIEKSPIYIYEGKAPNAVDFHVVQKHLQVREPLGTTAHEHECKLLFSRHCGKPWVTTWILNNVIDAHYVVGIRTDVQAIHGKHMIQISYTISIEDGT